VSESGFTKMIYVQYMQIFNNYKRYLSFLIVLINTIQDLTIDKLTTLPGYILTTLNSITHERYILIRCRNLVKFTR